MEKTLENPSAKHSKEYNDFFKLVEATGKVEDKLRMTLDFMRQALSKDKNPAFRDFWDAKRLCLEFFKESLTPRARGIFWQEYTELTEEIRNVKKILDEQSAFAEEQIDLAISSLEEQLKTSFEKIPMPMGKIFEDNKEKYVEIQSELNHLNPLSARIHALRKELIKLKIRMKTKNRFFERLSTLGNEVFPKRKVLMKELSDLFVTDVERFVNEEFKKDGPIIPQKNTIKSLQQFAKLLSLSSSVFMKTRQSLSKCWDELKEKESVEKDKQKQVDEKVLKQKSEEKLKRKKQTEAVENFKEKLIEFETKANELSLDVLAKERENLVKEEKALVSSEIERLFHESSLDKLADLIEEKKKQTFLEESGEDLKENLQMLLENRHKEKRVLKEALEGLRRKMGGSSLGLEESMLVQELILEKKARLESVIETIEEIEEKLFDLGS